MMYLAMCLCSNTVSTELLLRVGVMHALLMCDYIRICVDIITLFSPCERVWPYTLSLLYI